MLSVEVTRKENLTEYEVKTQKRTDQLSQTGTRDQNETRSSFEGAWIHALVGVSMASICSSAVQNLPKRR
jgi:hypothetical protein